MLIHGESAFASISFEYFQAIQHRLQLKVCDDEIIQGSLQCILSRYEPAGQCWGKEMTVVGRTGSTKEDVSAQHLSVLE